MKRKTKPAKQPATVMQLRVRGAAFMALFSLAVMALLWIASGEAGKSVRLMLIVGAMLILLWMVWVSSASKTGQEIMKEAQYGIFTPVGPDASLVDEGDFWRATLFLSAQLPERHRRSAPLYWVSQSRHQLIGTMYLVLGVMAELFVLLLLTVWLIFAYSDLPPEGFNHWSITSLFLVALVGIPIATCWFYWNWKYTYFIVTGTLVALVTVPPMWLLPVIAPKLESFDLAKINYSGHEKPKSYVWLNVDAGVVKLDIIGDQDKAFNRLEWMPEGARCYKVIETAREPYLPEPHAIPSEPVVVPSAPAPEPPKTEDTQPIKIPGEESP